MPVWKRILVWALRLSVGGVFVMSGLVKMIDLWGVVFKIEEYLAVWHLTQPRTIVFMLAFFMSGYEFVFGALLAMGCYKRVASWGLMLAMAVMLPLTAYVWIAEPVSHCGCFGDFLELSNAATFWKNVVITAGLVMLVLWNSRLKEALFNPAIQWMVWAWISLYIIIIGLYGYNAQPVADFRMYPVGSALGPSGAGGEEEFAFIYEKDGRQSEFSIDALPDSSWTFVDRVPVNGTTDRDGMAGIAIFDENGDDVTNDVIGGDSIQLLLVVPEPRRAGVTFTYAVNEIYEYADSVGIPFIALLGTDAEGLSRWRDNAMAEYQCYSVDDTQLKELARGNVSLVVLQGGAVASKTTLSSMDPDVLESPPSREAFMAELTGYGGKWFSLLNISFGGALVLLYFCQGIILAIRTKIKRKYRRKQVKNS